MFQFNILGLYNFTSYVRYLHIAVHCIHGALLNNYIVTSANPRATLTHLILCIIQTFAIYNRKAPFLS